MNGNNKPNNLDKKDETLFAQLGDNKYEKMPFKMASNEILGDPYTKSENNNRTKNEELKEAKKTVRIVGVEEPMPVKKKRIPEDRDYSKAAAIAVTTAAAVGATLFALSGLDDLMNPQYVLTTHPDFTNDTFWGFLERTPENISQIIEVFSGKVR